MKCKTLTKVNMKLDLRKKLNTLSADFAEVMNSIELRTNSNVNDECPHSKENEFATTYI